MKTTSKLRQIENRLDSLEETVEVLADKKLLNEIKKALDEVEEGRYKDYENVEQLKASM